MRLTAIALGVAQAGEPASGVAAWVNTTLNRQAKAKAAANNPNQAFSHHPHKDRFAMGQTMVRSFFQTKHKRPQNNQT
jgi:hypothetical protein